MLQLLNPLNTPELRGEGAEKESVMRQPKQSYAPIQAVADIVGQASFVQKPYTMAEFFAGGGLARLGFGPDWEVAFANDFCPDKAATYIANFGGTELHVGDVAQVKATAIPRTDIWWVSFPCTDHSTAGLRKGFAGVHGSAVFPVVKRIQAAKRCGTAPLVVAFENVIGFLSHGGGADFRLLVKQITSCGYRMGAVVMNAADWLPHGRRRVFLVAVRVDAKLPDGLSVGAPDQKWHPPVLRKAVAKLGAKSLASWVWWTMPEPDAHGTTLADILEVENAGKWFGSEKIARFKRLVDKLGQARLAEMMAVGRPVFATMVERTCPTLKKRIASIRADYAFCLMASATGTSRQRLLEVNGPTLRIREYTRREVARLMGVPENYQVPKGLVPAVSLLGDAVAVPVVRYLAHHLIEPLVLAARRADAARPRALADGHRPIKAKTKGVVVYMLPGEHQRLKDIAANDGEPLYQWYLKAANDRLIEVAPISWTVCGLGSYVLASAVCMLAS